MVTFSGLLHKLLHHRRPNRIWLIKERTRRVPCLLLPYHGFLDVSTHNFCPLAIPEAHGKRICGSSRGWLVVIDEIWKISMLNPLTKAQIQLPSLSLLFEESGLVCGAEIPTDFVHKALIFSDPHSASQGRIVVLFYGESRRLAFHKIGADEPWKTIPDTGGFHDDVVIYRENLYAVDDCGRVVFLEPGLDVVEEVAGSWLLQGDKAYLVGINDILHVVVRFLDRDPELGHKTREFKVYRLEAEKDKWQRVRCLGDEAIFLGINQTMSVSAQCVEGLKGNCIYFTDDWYNSGKDGVDGGDDTGVFSLEDESIQPLICSPNVPKLFSSSPVWFCSHS